jgi:hypothetical protein
MNVGVLPLGISFYLLVSHPISHRGKKEIEWKGNQMVKEIYSQRIRIVMKN